MRRFEFSEGTSNKFWEVEQEGASVTVRFGRIGTNGQIQTKTYGDEKKAASALAKLVAEKTKKGYVEITPANEAGEKRAKPATVSAKAAPAAAKKSPAPPAGPAGVPPGFLPAGKGYLVGIRDDKLVCQNAKGQMLSSVPKDVKESDVGEQLAALLEWLEAHARACVAWAEDCMLRSLPLPASVVEAVWVDEAYRRALENLVVFAIDRDGRLDGSKGGMLRGAEESRGLGVVDRDGETRWLKVDRIGIPHPIIIDALDDWRALATELGAAQETKQLFREVFEPPKGLEPAVKSIDRYEGAKFKQLNHAIGTAKTLGYRVSGGSAVCRVLERGKVYEARYWIGDDDPMSEAVTGSLVWVDDKQVEIAITELPPIALSEGTRMAAAIHAKRVIEEQERA